MKTFFALIVLWGSVFYVSAQTSNRVWQINAQGATVNQVDFDGPFTLEAMVMADPNIRDLGLSPIFYSTSGSSMFGFALNRYFIEVTTPQNEIININRYIQAVIEPNTWYHCAWVLNGTSVRYYLNGCLMDSVAVAGKLNFAGNVRIGERNGFEPDPLVGKLDEIRFWKGARNAEQIQNHMSTAIDFANEPELYGYINLEGVATNRIEELRDRPTFAVNPASGGYSIENVALTSPPLFTIDSLLIQPLSCQGVSDASMQFFTTYPQYASSIRSPFQNQLNSFPNLGAGAYTLRIQLPTSCVLSWNFTIEPRRNLNAQPTYQSTGCFGDELTLKANVVDSVHVRWLSTDLMSNAYQLVIPHDSAEQSIALTVSHLECSQTFNVIIPPAETLLPRIEGSVPCLENRLQLCVSGGTFAQTEWLSGGNQTCIEVDQPGTYHCKVTSEIGCEAFAQYEVSDCVKSLFIPTGFTPDGDGLNDYFEVVENNVTVESMRIWDRWGRELMYRFGAPWKWDGTYMGNTVAQGAYAIQITYVNHNGQRNTQNAVVQAIR